LCTHPGCQLKHHNVNLSTQDVNLRKWTYQQLAREEGHAEDPEEDEREHPEQEHVHHVLSARSSCPSAMTSMSASRVRKVEYQHGEPLEENRQRGSEPVKQEYAYQGARLYGEEEEH